jgi:hypothetical protein
MWNPFRKSAKTEAEEPEPPKRKRKLSRLPDYDDREDTQRIVATLADYRASKEESAEDLEEAAECVKDEAKVTSHTMRSMPAFKIPPQLAEEDAAG